MARRKAVKTYKVLAMNTAGHLTYCTAPPERRGMGRCNHMAHQEEEETAQEFTERAERELKALEEENKGTNKIPGSKPIFDFDPDNKGETKSIKYKSKPYRMTEEERAEAEEIYGRLQLDNDYGTKKLYMKFETPLWNDVDIEQFAEISGEKAKNIRGVILGDVDMIIESNDPDYAPGTILTPFRTKKIKEKQEAEGKEDIVFGNSVEALNKAAEHHGFKATEYASVLPYNMRPSSDTIDHPLTVAYKYLLNRRKNPQNQQLAYMALLNNRALDKDLQRFNDGYSQPSLADEFAGKSGVFRKYMSGRSVPYAGRAVIDPTTDVEYGEIKVPAAMAIDIYKPTLIKQFLKEGKTEDDFDEFVSKFRSNKIDPRDAQELERRMDQGKVRALMNRQPSSHLGNLQSYKPKVTTANAVLIHPMYDEAYGGDHDGDQVTIMGINNPEISEVADRSLGAKLDINTRRPRKQDEYQVMPQKDVLFGLMSILKQRSK